MNMDQVKFVIRKIASGCLICNIFFLNKPVILAKKKMLWEENIVRYLAIMITRMFVIIEWIDCLDLNSI